MLAEKTFVIATVQRSGSYLLTEGLASTGVAGVTREWLNPMEIKRFCAKHQLPHPPENLETYLARVRQVATTPNGVFGFKCLAMQWNLLRKHFAEYPKYRLLPFHEVVPHLFPNLHYVHLVRRDKVRQAISFYRAAKTGVWTTAKAAASPPADIPPYDALSIIRYQNIIKNYEAVWDNYFEVAGIQPLRVEYEDLAADYQGTLRRVLAYLGVENTQAMRFTPPRLKKQADATTEEWVRRFTDSN